MLHGGDMVTVLYVSRCRQPPTALPVLAMFFSGRDGPNLPNAPGRPRMSGHRRYHRASSRTPARPLERS